MTTVGLRELRQQASEYVRRAEAGETIQVAVSGRVVAELRPVQRSAWRRAEDVDFLFSGPADPDWERDRDLIDGTVRDPFSR